MRCLTSIIADREIQPENYSGHFRSCFSLLSAAAWSIVSLSSAASAATDQECLASWQEPQVTIEIVNAEPVLDHSKSSRQIEIVAKKSGYAKSTRHANLLGLTYSFITPKLGAATKYTAEKSGKYCIRLDRVSLKFGAHKTNIYIDRKYRKETCPYETILAHELEHVRINEQIIAEYVPKIKRELAERAAAIRPFHTTSPKTAGRSIANRLLFELDPLLDEFNAVRMQANNIIDTPESYAATQAKCNDW